MTFKEWIKLFELIDIGEPEKERPDLLAKALHGIHPGGEDPPPGPPTATSAYAIKRKLMKKCRKG
jgi:hypothetical protein